MGIATEEAGTRTDKLHRPTSMLATLTGTIVRKLKTDFINATKNILKYFARNIYVFRSLRDLVNSCKHEYGTFPDFGRAGHG